MDFIREKGKLTISLNGRIDSNNAAEIEKEIFSEIEGSEVTEVTFDAGGLNYISSAGLRVLMKIRKKVGKGVEIVDVSRDVYDIFETTGFTEVLTVRKALRRLSVDGCEVVGEGATSVVYRLDQDTIVKVFRPGVRFDMINDESKKAKRAFIAGVPTAIAYDLVKVKDSYGTVYEMLDAKELIKVLVEDKAHIEDHIRAFAKIVKATHDIEVDPAEFMPVRTASIGALSYLEGSVATPEETAKLKGIFEIIPERNTFVHGDCHPGNVMVQNGELTLIDLSNGGSGHPVFDLVSMYLTYCVHPMDPQKRKTGIMLKDFTDEEIAEIWDVFIRSYLDTDDEDLISKATKQIDGISSTRILLAVPFIPGLLSEQAIQFFKHKAIEFYDAGLEELCF